MGKIVIRIQSSNKTEVEGCLRILFESVMGYPWALGERITLSLTDHRAPLLCFYRARATHTSVPLRCPCELPGRRQALDNRKSTPSSRIHVTEVSSAIRNLGIEHSIPSTARRGIHIAITFELKKISK